MATRRLSARKTCFRRTQIRKKKCSSQTKRYLTLEFPRTAGLFLFGGVSTACRGHLAWLCVSPVPTSLQMRKGGPKDDIVIRWCLRARLPIRNRKVTRESRHDIGTQTGFLLSSRYFRPPSSIYRFHLGHISASSPLYALSFISCAFHNPRCSSRVRTHRFNTRPIGQFDEVRQ